MYLYNAFINSKAKDPVMKNNKNKSEISPRESKEMQKRHLEMFKMLLDKPMSANDITINLNDLDYKVNLRSVQRDLKAFNGTNGLLSEDDPSNSRRPLWRVHSFDFSSPKELDDTGALAIVIAQKQLASAAPPQINASLKDAFERAEKLLKQTNTEASRWYQRVRVISPSHFLKPPKLNKDVYDCIRDAALRNAVVKFSYKKHSHDEAKGIVATGLGLFYRETVAYFIAFDHEGNKIKHYPISRIEEANQAISAQPQHVNEFNIDEFEKSGFLAYRYGKPFRLQAIIFYSVQREIEDAHLGDNQVVTSISKNNEFKLLEVDVPYDLNLIQWLLARAAYLKVLGPPEFKLKFDEELRLAYNNVKNEQPFVPKEKNFGGKSGGAT
jgi:predicted DNA-binding transcriptional regulator YafY